MSLAAFASFALSEAPPQAQPPAPPPADPVTERFDAMQREIEALREKTARQDDQIERLTEAAGEMRFVGRQRGDEIDGRGRILATGGNRTEERRPHATHLTNDGGPVDRERRETDAKERHLRIFDPVAGQVADDSGVRDHTAVNQGEEGEGDRAAPEQGRPQERRRQAVEIRHQRLPPEARTRVADDVTAARSIVSIGTSCPTD
jgi:hypothetical protein